MKKSKKREKRKRSRARRDRLTAPNRYKAAAGTEWLGEDQQSLTVIDVAEDRQSRDERLLDSARTQWQIGDWKNLARLGDLELDGHADRAKLALLAAAGYLQDGDVECARTYLELAQRWGCSKRTMALVLVAGVYSTLARTALLNNEKSRALELAETAIRLVTPNADVTLLGETRSFREATNLGLLTQAGELMRDQLHGLGVTEPNSQTRLKLLETEVELLQHELALAQRRGQISPGGQPPADLNEIEPVTRLAARSMSQLGQDLWVAEKTGYRRGGFFVEFGASDGVLLSNTHLLEAELNWTGICCEPNPKFVEKLRQNRNCVVSDRYIGGTTGEKVSFVLAGVYGTDIQHLESDMHAAKRANYRDSGLIVELTSISLDDFLKEYGAPQRIDYLSVDTEGSEYDILSHFPFDEWDVRLLTVEHNNSPQKHAIRELMKTAGYDWTEVQWEDWYEKRS